MCLGDDLDTAWFADICCDLIYTPFLMTVCIYEGRWIVISATHTPGIQPLGVQTLNSITEWDL